MMKMRSVLLITIFSLCLFLSGCAEKKVDTTSGVLDLTAWSFAEDGLLSLDNQWEFYWQKLLTAKDLATTTPDLYVNVPSTWDSYTINGAHLSGQGYATYHLHVKTALSAGTKMSLWINNFSSAYNLYIDNDLISSNGRVADNAEGEIGEYRSQVVNFEIPASEFDIIVQVSNFHYARGGFWYNLVLGNQEDVSRYSDFKTLISASLLGAALIVALYCFFVWFSLKEMKYNLLFGLLCLCVGVFYDSLNMMFLWRLFPQLSFNGFLFLWYSSGIWSMLLLVAYFNALFCSRVSAILTRIFFLLTIGFQLLQIFASPVIYSGSVTIGSINIAPQMILFFAEFLSVLAMMAVSIKNKKKYIGLQLLGIVFLMITFFHDALSYTHIINYGWGEIFAFGAFAFLLIQLIAQTMIMREFQKAKAEAELKFLHAQIRPHFLYNAMNTFISVSRYDPDNARKLMTDFSEYLRKSFDLKSKNQLVPLKDEIRLTEAYLNIEKARFEERVEVSFEIPENREIMVPSCMLQPVVENAVIHGISPKPEGGRIKISIRQQNNALLFSVIDNGIGIDPEELGHITKIQSEGVGLANISQRLSSLYGKKLYIKSKRGEGTEIFWEIPLKMKWRNLR